MSSVSLINGHIEEDTGLYILSDVECPRVYGVFTTLEKAIEAREALIMRFVDKCLAAPAEETGLTENDRDWLIMDTSKSFMIDHLHADLNMLDSSYV
jgi:hypothetical protein